MRVELISVGTELLMGNVVNTNAAYLSAQCATLGLSCLYQQVVGDNWKRLEESISFALSRTDVLILSGGLGPTEDDITKEVVAKHLDLRLVLDEETKDRIEAFFHRRKGKDISENNWKQAYIPEGAQVLKNENGTAPGIYLFQNNQHIFLLPGPPNELIPMFERECISVLKKLDLEPLYTKMVKISTIGESRAEEMIKDLIQSQENPTIAPYAKTGEVHFRVTAKAKEPGEAEEMMAPILAEMYRRFGNGIYTTKEEESLPQVVVRMLADKGYHLSCAESCTGGLFASTIVSVSGASLVFEEGLVTYSNSVKKRRLGVLPETLERYGAVSEEVVKEMAIGVRKGAKSDWGIGITGIAGPEGGNKEKPVGMVWIGLSGKNVLQTRCFYFQGNREKIRELTVIQALNLIREELIAEDETK